MCAFTPPLKETDMPTASPCRSTSRIEHLEPLLTRSSDSLRARRVVEVWAVDPEWLRIQWCDDRGEPLGLVTFEKRTPTPNPALPPMFRTLCEQVASAVIRLAKETRGCRLSIS